MLISSKSKNDSNPFLVLNLFPLLTFIVNILPSDSLSIIPTCLANLIKVEYNVKATAYFESMTGADSRPRCIFPISVGQSGNFMPQQQIQQQYQQEQPNPMQQQYQQEPNPMQQQYQQQPNPMQQQYPGFQWLNN